jgi:sodium pump decarboxylase gamma subunit
MQITSSLMDSLQLTVVAMGIVFAALYALSLVMGALPKLVGGQKEKPAAPNQAKQAPISEPAVVEPQNDALSATTVAVIASALAAYLGQDPANLNVIAIRRTGSGLSPWAMNVRRESVQN